MLLSFLLTLAPAVADGWTPLPLPALSAAPLPNPGAPPLHDGRHLRSDDDSPWQSEAPLAPLPPGVLMQLLEEDARLRGHSVRFQSGAPEEVADTRRVVRALDAIAQALEVTLEVWLLPNADETPPLKYS